MAADTAIFAGGCFWCTEAVFKSLAGVSEVESGYIGGQVDNPTYKAVCSGTTGHAEAIRISFDPDVINYDDLLDVHFATHDPTQLNRQGNDIGTQYRSAVYWTTPEQEKWVTESRNAYNDVLVGKGFDPITSELAPASNFKFWYAEEYHQQYLIKNPNGYDCHAHTGILLPQIAALSS
jgi:peptide-methionine (S)-S-oxide reductase